MLIELIKEDYLDVYLEYLNRDKKKFRNVRFIFGGIMFLAFALGVLIMKKYMLFLGIPIAFLIGYKLPYLNLMMSKKQSDLMVSFMFPQFLQTFMALLSTSGNVYQTLKATLPYTSEPLKGRLKNLVAKIEDENNRDNYVEFAEFVGTSEAYMIMDMIYQFSEFGVRKEIINELKNYIQNLQENKVDELIERKMVAVEKYGFAPVFISLFMILGYAGVIFWYYMHDVMDALELIF